MVRGEMGFARWGGSKTSARTGAGGEGLRGLAAYRRGRDGRWRLLRLVWNRPPTSAVVPDSTPPPGKAQRPASKPVTIWASRRRPDGSRQTA